jgi:ABC-type multidrug transport system fused ATPase/permease subunit
MYYIGPILGVFLFLILALAVVAAILWTRLSRLTQSYRALTAGTDGGSLEAVLEQHVGDVRTATTRVEALDTTTRRLERASRTYLQRVGFLRFNPFRDAGGDQSFALALADQDGNGVVISSLHSRDVTRVYGKALVAWESVYPLTDEEKQAIDKAQKKTPSNGELPAVLVSDPI